MAAKLPVAAKCCTTWALPRISANWPTIICRAYDLTGAEEAELASQLQAGNPVIFWATLHFGDIQHDPCGEYDLPGGRRHEVLHTLHCMVLCGMDDQNFVVADPLDFNRVVPRVQFMKIYRQLGRRAVAIKKDS